MKELAIWIDVSVYVVFAVQLHESRSRLRPAIAMELTYPGTALTNLQFPARITTGGVNSFLKYTKLFVV